MVTLASRHAPPSLSAVWKEICKRHLHGFAVTHKCPASLQTLHFHHSLLLRTAKVPTLPCYRGGGRGRREMVHGCSKPRSGQDGDSGCLHRTHEACAMQRTPNPLQLSLCPAPGTSEGIQALTTPCSNWSQQEPVHYRVVHCICSCFAVQGLKHKLVLCGLCVCSLSIPPSCMIPLKESICCQPSPKWPVPPPPARQAWPWQDFI